MAPVFAIKEYEDVDRKLMLANASALQLYVNRYSHSVICQLHWNALPADPHTTFHLSSPLQNSISNSITILRVMSISLGSWCTCGDNITTLQIQLSTMWHDTMVSVSCTRLWIEMNMDTLQTTLQESCCPIRAQTHVSFPREKHTLAATSLQLPSSVNITPATPSDCIKPELTLNIHG